MNNKILFKDEFLILQLLFFPFSVIVTTLKNPYNNLFKKTIQIFLALLIGFLVHLWLYVFTKINIYFFTIFQLISIIGTLIIIGYLFKDFSKRAKLLIILYLLFIIYWWFAVLFNLYIKYYR